MVAMTQTSTTTKFGLGGPRGTFGRPVPAPSGLARRLVVLLASVAAAALGGCAAGPRALPPDERRPLDRKLVDVPPGFDLEPYATGLTGPVAMAFDGDGNLLVAEGGFNGEEPRIYGFTPALARFDVYPLDKPVLPFAKRKFQLYGPIGSILWHNGGLYVSHRDADDYGVISKLDYKGGARTVVAGLPARGEHGVTDMAVDPRTRRLFFGIGSATNSGVVGLDDYDMGWVKRHPDVADVPYTPDVEARLWAQKLFSANPAAVWFMPDIAITAAYQAFGTSAKTRIKGATRDNPKPNSAILSCDPDGGDLKVEMHGVRLPRGLGIDRRRDRNVLFFTNQGMEARGTRPVNNDVDSFCRHYPGVWAGFPDFTADFQPVTDPKFQPPDWLIAPSGSSELSYLVNHAASQWVLGNPRDHVYGVFPSQSGAWRFDFAPDAGPFREFSGSAIVALFGDRAPYATGGQKLLGPVGFKLVQVDVDRGQLRDFVKNVRPGPASQHDGGGGYELERPIDVKFGPDGALYILDYGKMRVRDGRFDASSGTGRIYRLIPSRAAAGGGLAP
jgi:glucose/arabinose dehydrogenase